MHPYTQHTHADEGLRHRETEIHSAEVNISLFVCLPRDAEKIPFLVSVTMTTCTAKPSKDLRHVHLPERQKSVRQPRVQKRVPRFPFRTYFPGSLDLKDAHPSMLCTGVKASHACGQRSINLTVSHYGRISKSSQKHCRAELSIWYVLSVAQTS
jgi:hypothetical protein